jgi:hypothetical protein
MKTVYGEGSNVDLGFPQDVYDDLVEGERQLDHAVEQLKGAIEDLNSAEDIYLESWKKAYVEASVGQEKITKAKADANARVTRQLLQRDAAKAVKEYALENLRSKRAILSAIQTRASLMKQQIEMDITSSR